MSTICTSVCSEVPIIAASARSSGRLQADSAWSLRQWPSSSSSSRFSSIALDVDRRRRRRLAAREGDEQRSSNSGAHVDVAAGVGQGEQHAVELAAVERVARRLAGLLAQVELEARAIRWRSRGSIAGSRNGRDGRDDAHAQLAVQRLALGAGHVGQLLALAQDAHRLVGDLLAERR